MPNKSGDKLLIPSHFTTHEGGRWIPWPGPALWIDDLDSIRAKHHIHSDWTEDSVVLEGVKVHELRWSSKNARWNCHKGFIVEVGGFRLVGSSHMIA